MKKLTLVFSVLLGAALLSSYSSAIAAHIRPEVARPLDEARVLANGWGDKATVMAKLNQAASVPNLNSDERDKIRAAGKYALARFPLGASFPNIDRDTMPAPPPAIGWTGLH